MSKTKKDSKSRARGNTKSLAKKDTEHKEWFFTWNNYEKDDIKSLQDWLNKRKGMSYMFQEEQGEQTGTKHLQGCFKCTSAIKFSTIKNMFPKMNFKPCKDWDASVTYCSKTETRIGGTFTNIRIKRPIEHGFILDKASEWQKFVIGLMDIPADDRTINWIWHPNGKKGKSKLARYLILTYPGQVIYINGKGTDIKFAIQKFLMNEENDLKLIIFGYPRSKEGYISYTAIEEVKDGLFFSTKYESGMCIFNHPHVVALANFEPDYDALSKDRWNVMKATENELFSTANIELEMD